jgi:hypothetical protein
MTDRRCDNDDDMGREERKRKGGVNYNKLRISTGVEVKVGLLLLCHVAWTSDDGSFGRRAEAGVPLAAKAD